MKLVQTASDLNTLKELLTKAPWVAFDSEANGLEIFSDTFVIAGLCFAVGPDEGWYLPIHHWSPDMAMSNGLFSGVIKPPFKLWSEDEARELLCTTGVLTKPMVGHNLKYDLHVLRRLGLRHEGPEFDTLLACQVEDAYRENGLKQRVKDFFGYQPETFGEVAEEDHDFTKTDPLKSYTYAAADAVNTWRLATYLVKRTAGTEVLHVCETVEFPLVRKLVDIESCGVELDTGAMEVYSKNMEVILTELENDIRKMSRAGITLASGDERYNFVYKYLKCPFPDGREPERSGATDEETLTGVRSTIARMIDEAKKILELLSTAHTAHALYNRIERFMFLARDHSPIPNSVSEAQQLIKDLSASLPLKAHLVSMLQSWCKIFKLKTAFMDKLPANRGSDGRIHTQFRQILRSGRQAGVRPNLMQLPRDQVYKAVMATREVEVDMDVRKCILPPVGWVFVSADWDSMEMKMAAVLSGCPVLTGVVCGYDKAGQPLDIHLRTAELMGLLPAGLDYDEAVKALKGDGKKKPLHQQHKAVKDARQRVKPIGFGLVYGITKWGLAIQLKCTPEEAESLMELYFRTFPGVARWIERSHSEGRDRGYAATLLGRRRCIPEAAYEDDALLEHYVRALTNHEDQGSCADMAKYCERQICDAIAGTPIQMCNFIHDELILMCPDEPRWVNLAAAALAVCMQKTLRGVQFTATPEVKRNLSKAAPDISATYDQFAGTLFREDVANRLGQSLSDLATLPWIGN